MAEPLLHLTTGLEWRTALHAGCLLARPFLHLSTPEQVALPANRLFAGRTDMLLLVVDPDRLEAEVRWEPGVATDPSSMRFPHLYGPLPVAAVIAVVPYRPGDDGTYAQPAGLPSSPEERARWFDRGLAQRRAAEVVRLPVGVAALDPRVAHSYEHNTLWLEQPGLDAATIVAAADEALAGFAHRRVVADEPLPDLGWAPRELRLLLHNGPAPAPPAIPVVSVTGEVMARLWEPTWRRDASGVADEVIEHLVRREGIADAHLALTHLAVLGDGGTPLAAAQLRVDGATAAVEEVMTDPAAQGRGYGTAVVVEAVRRARAAGCDVVFLVAYADDWPRRWYERLRFVDVGGRWEAIRS